VHRQAVVENVENAHREFPATRKLKAASTAFAYAKRTMIDNFSLGLTHALMLFAAWRLLTRVDLDREETAPPEQVEPRTSWRGR